RHHIRGVGSVVVENCDVGTVASIVNGAEKLWLSSTWIVYDAAPVTSLQSNVIAWPGAKRASPAGACWVGAGSVTGGGADACTCTVRTAETGPPTPSALKAWTRQNSVPLG